MIDYNKLKKAHELACNSEKYWFKANTNPEYLICKNRLIREYNRDYINQMYINNLEQSCTVTN